MNYLDAHQDVITWSSEEFCIPYRSPVDGAVHRYFPDFWLKQRKLDGTIETVVVEIKPKKQTMPPEPQKKRTKAPNRLTMSMPRVSPWHAGGTSRRQS